MKTPEIFAFLGVIGSGKDHRAAQITATHERVDFKDALIEMVSDILGYDIRPEYEWFKEALIGFRKPDNPLREGMVRSEMADLKKRYPWLMTGREMLQRVGTDVMRKRDPDYWVDQWYVRAGRLLQEGKSVVVADCRFANEVDTLLKMSTIHGGVASFIFCDYRSPRYDPTSPHESERVAQALLAMGCDDGQVLSPADIMAALAKSEKELDAALEVLRKSKEAK